MIKMFSRKTLYIYTHFLKMFKGTILNYIFEEKNSSLNAFLLAEIYYMYKLLENICLIFNSFNVIFFSFVLNYVAYANFNRFSVSPYV